MLGKLCKASLCLNTCLFYKESGNLWPGINTYLQNILMQKETPGISTGYYPDMGGVPDKNTITIMFVLLGIKK